ncbi:MAG: phosphatase domain-containing protein [Candidatus Nanopelagicales bacterium]
MLNGVARLPRRIASELNARLRSPETAAAVAGIEGRLTRRRREQKMESGAFRGMHVVVYRGYVADDVAKVRVKVMETPELPGDSRIPYWETMQANLRRHGALAIVGVEVELRIAGHSAKEYTDGRGFANFSVPVPRLKSGWHDAFAVTTPIEDGESASGTGRVLKPAAKAPFAVISDIDDTILVSGLTEGLNAVKQALLRDANTRSAVRGMSSLYRGLARGVPARTGSRAPEPAFFYVSTGSWSFYEMLQQFIQLRAFPQGPMFLTDWGPTERYLRRSGAEHKRVAIRRLFEAYPDTDFVLIGDSGQRDALTYEEMAREFTGHVKLILIRQVGSAGDERNAELAKKATALRGEGVPLYLVEDAVHAADLARAMDLCDEETVLQVRTELGRR